MTRSTASVVGITGSTGKTSTKDVLRALLEPHVRVVASRENQNNELGVPLTVCRTEPDTEVAGGGDGDARRWARSPTWPRSPAPTSP